MEGDKDKGQEGEGKEEEGMAHTPKLSVSDTLKQPMRDGHKQPLKEKKDRTRAKGDDKCVRKRKG